MRKFNISVNGNSYSVEVEEIGGATVATPVVAAPIPTPVASVKPVVAAKPLAAAPVVAPVAAKPEVAAGNGTIVKSPLPGTIVKVSVSNGQAIKKGDVILVLEAMKMENDVSAPCDGIVTVSATKGSQVNTGEVIATIA